MSVVDLANLHDLMLPAPIGWWPLAVGWQILMAFALVAISYAFYKIFWRWQNSRAKRMALKLLKIYEQEYNQHNNSAEICAKISELLRRVALAYYPRDEVASLEGETWLIFLNKNSKITLFSELRDYLLTLPYQKYAAQDLGNFFIAVRKWIKAQGATC